MATRCDVNLRSCRLQKLIRMTDSHISLHSNNNNYK